MTHSLNYLLSQRTPHIKTNIHPIITFLEMGKQLTAIKYRNWHIVVNDTKLSTNLPSKPLSAYTKSNSIYNYLLYSAQTYSSSQHFKENIHKICWECLLFPLWNVVVNTRGKMIALVVGWVCECCSEFSTQIAIP